MKVERIEYHAGGRRFLGALVYDETSKAKRPLMLMAPNWLGVTPEAIARTAQMCGSTHVGFVACMYGDGKTCSGPPESLALANALRDDPAERRLRIKAALDTLIAESEKRGIGDATRVSAVGFCFGGGNVLELARIGANVNAVVCLHGDLTTKAAPSAPGSIKAKILVLHGSVDPAADKTQRDALEAELDAAKANWQMLVFGGLLHSFSESESYMAGIAEYNEPAARQSYRLLEQFIQDAFAGRL
ncbi:MAG: dienelactone hydrolase family protein [Bradyrhizobium sp.]|nr:dienelactone hydrolase family protein [Bradyrhizobium sp.]